MYFKRELKQTLNFYLKSNLKLENKHKADKNNQLT